MFARSLVSLSVAALVSCAGYAEEVIRPGNEAAQLCVNCHVQSAEQMGTLDSQLIPLLGRQQPEYLVNSLKAYSQRQRNHFFMRGVAAGLDERQLEEVVQFFTSAPAPEKAKDPTKRLMPPAAATCIACHGDGGTKPISSDIPILAGQHALYLQKAFEAYASGARKHPLMQSQATDPNGKPTLTTDEIQAVTSWFSSQPDGVSGR